MHNFWLELTGNKLNFCANDCGIIVAIPHPYRGYVRVIILTILLVSIVNPILPFQPLDGQQN